MYEGRIRTLFVFRDVRQAVECLGFFPTQFLRIWENLEKPTQVLAAASCAPVG